MYTELYTGHTVDCTPDVPTCVPDAPSYAFGLNIILQMCPAMLQIFSSCGAAIYLIVQMCSSCVPAMSHCALGLYRCALECLPDCTLDCTLECTMYTGCTLYSTLTVYSIHWMCMDCTQCTLAVHYWTWDCIQCTGDTDVLQMCTWTVQQMSTGVYTGVYTILWKNWNKHQRFFCFFPWGPGRHN